MAKIKSAQKRIRQIKKRTAHNRLWKRQLREALKKVRTSVSAKAKPEEINASFTQAQKVIDKAAQKKVIHRNKAARLKTSLSKRIRAAAQKI